MKVEKISVEPVFSLLEMTEKEFIMLKVIVNRTGSEEDECVKENEEIWEDYMSPKEARDIAGKVANIIWGLTVEEDYHGLQGSVKK